MASTVGSVSGVEREVTLAAARDQRAAAQAWIDALRSDGPERERSAARLHALLLRASRFELTRRRAQLHWLRGETLEDLALQSADSALIAVMTKLDQYRFESRFTTWAYKFAILEAAVAARRRAWQEHELPIDPHDWGMISVRTRTDGPAEDFETREQLRELAAAIRTRLSPHQREVLTALVLAEVPIDVLAERLNTTRGALYKTLHDARRKLRAALVPEKA